MKVDYAFWGGAICKNLIRQFFQDDGAHLLN